MSDFSSRPARDSDIPVIMTLLDDAGFLTPGARYDTPEYFIQSVTDGIFFVATDSHDHVIGMIHGERLMCNGAVLWYFVVHPDFRGRGVGDMLIIRFQDFCRANQITWIFGSSDINPRTQKFYTKHGFDLSTEYIEFTKNL